MALILSIETATKVCSVALHLDGKLLANHVIALPKSHLEYLMELVNMLFVSTSYNKDELDAVAVSMGPGSYTGLRIGVSVAKGLCYGSQIPLIGINTLEAMLYSVRNFNVYDAYMCPMIDAKRMDVYCLVADSKMSIVKPTCIMTLRDDSFDKWEGDKIILFGDGLSKLEGLFKTRPNVISFRDVSPNAVSMGAIAYERFLNVNFEEIHSFEPLYISGIK
jgi:tRNA threonylcarbamoyladenosine biosynthesis protein TsaB